MREKAGGKRGRKKFSRRDFLPIQIKHKTSKQQNFSRNGKSRKKSRPAASRLNSTYKLNSGTKNLPRALFTEALGTRCPPRPEDEELGFWRNCDFFITARLPPLEPSRGRTRAFESPHLLWPCRRGGRGQGEAFGVLFRAGVWHRLPPPAARVAPRQPRASPGSRALPASHPAGPPLPPAAPLPTSALSPYPLPWPPTLSPYLPAAFFPPPPQPARQTAGGGDSTWPCRRPPCSPAAPSRCDGRWRGVAAGRAGTATRATGWPSSAEPWPWGRICPAPAQGWARWRTGPRPRPTGHHHRPGRGGPGDGPSPLSPLHPPTNAATALGGAAWEPQGTAAARGIAARWQRCLSTSPRGTEELSRATQTRLFC